MKNIRLGKVWKQGFTLVELLIVIIIIAVLAAVAIPKFKDSGIRSKESALRSNLKVVRDAIDVFKTDTGTYPAGLSDLSATSAPTAGLDNTGTSKSITASDWRGPYVQDVPVDINGSAFTYSTASGSVGKINASSGTALDGSNYNTW
ncbi:MAG: prepilin-type N-terminal cleavage/methylation domain-containing protein [Armatimonadetes bacterium]|nr:prepilin-type N-terminal cleavage/methylation domain-containing protein [Armatimonadota bacterium]